MHRLVVQRSLLRRSLGEVRRAYHASVLPNLVSTTSPEFKAKAESMDALVADFEAKVAAARLGGGTKAAERMRSKGKKLPRERCVVLHETSTAGQLSVIVQVGFTFGSTYTVP